MRMWKAISAGATTAAVLLAFGCAREQAETAEGADAGTYGDQSQEPATEISEQEIPGTGQTDDLAPTTAMAKVEDLKVGAELGTDGVVAEAADNFQPGEKIYVSLTVDDLGAGSQVAAVWMGPDEQQLHTETKSVLQGDTHLVFEAPDTTAWAPGDYAVEIRVGDEVGGTERFDISEQAG